MLLSPRTTLPSTHNMRIEDIEKRAEKVLKESQTESLPIDLKKIAKKHGIIISEAPNKSDDISGLLLRSEKKTLVGVNSFHHSNRKRFTIAHELGHYFLHETGDTFVDNNSNLELLVKFRDNSAPKTQEEREANCFAAALLMPAKSVQKHFNSLVEVIDDTTEIINKLSDKYEVSYDAMMYRLINLDLVRS